MEFPPTTPFTLHVTEVFDEPETVAVNCCVCDTETDAPAGETETETPWAIVTVANADFAGFPLVAPIVTVAGFGSDEGAVYSPVAEIVPIEVFPPATPFTLHTTVLEPAPVAEN